MHSTPTGRLRALFATFLLTPLAAAAPVRSGGLPLDGAEAEAFLRTAEVVEVVPLDVGITHSDRLTLRQGERTARAIWKTIHTYKPMVRFGDGGYEMGFQDSYKNEVAAYELDKLIGLEMVPPVVERKIGKRTGSLQIWVEDALMETERREAGITPTDMKSWNRQIYNVRLFHNLTSNADFNNITNILSVEASKIYLIDHSRAFRVKSQLIAASDLESFSRPVLAALRTLDEATLRARLGRWLRKAQIKTLLVRRDLIVERAERLIAERGEAAVLFP